MAIKYTKVYICNKKQSCNMSPLCGRDCMHTTKEEFREKSDNTLWRIKRSKEEIHMIEVLPNEV